MPQTAPKLGKQANRLFIRNDGVLCRHFKEHSKALPRSQVLIPCHLRGIVLEQLHDNCGHCGVMKTLGKIKERFYWPGYESAVEEYVRACRQCQTRKSPNPKTVAPIGEIKTSRPFEWVSWDITGPLPETDKGNRYIVVITDLFTKWVEAFPLRTVDSETLATVFVDEVVCRYGVPTHLHSDQGANLCGQVIDKMCQILGISRTQTSAYHPQGNGQVERLNRTLKDMLAKSIHQDQRNWDRELQKVLFAYRVSINESTGYTPFLATFGRSPQLPVDVMFQTEDSSNNVNLPQFVKRVQSSIRRCTDRIRHNLVASRKKGQRGRVVGENLEIGDRVYLYVPAVQKGKTRKLASLWRGPYTVIDRLGPVNYRIQLIGNRNKVSVVHRNRLKVCYERPVQGHDNQEGINLDIDLPRFVEIDHEPIAGSTTLGENDTTLTETQIPPTGTARVPATRHSTRNRRPPDRYGPFVTSH